MTKPKQRLSLDTRELKIIKALTGKSDLNDQIIVAMFSHASRTVNHRVVGMIRKGVAPYAKISAASQSEVDEFLSRYGRFERVARELRILPDSIEFRLLSRARDAMIAAISAYNRPEVRWKVETFIVNSIIAWTYLHHAHYRRLNVDIRYKDKQGAVVTTPTGQPKLWELSKCMSVNSCPLSTPAKKNLEYLLAIRHEIEHTGDHDLDVFVTAKLQACAINFNRYIEDLFGSAYALDPEHGIAIQLTRFSLAQSEVLKSAPLPASIQAANKLVETGLSEADFNSLEYSYRVFVVPKTVSNKNKADEAVVLLPADADLSAHLQSVALKEVERKKYRPGDIVATMKKEGHKTFNMHKFVSLWKQFDGKNPKHGLGADVAGMWYWYEAMVVRVREHLAKDKK